MPQLTCPYPWCEWKFSGALEHTVERAREAHIAACINAPRRPRLRAITTRGRRL